MKIKELTIKNFKNTPDRTYELDKINVALGKNGKGKTSMLNALRYVLSGKLPGDPVRHGQDHLDVGITLEDGTSIERTAYVPDTWKINGNVVKEKAFVAKVSEYKSICEASGTSPVIGGNSNPFFIGQDDYVIWNFLLTGKADGARMNGIKELEVTFQDGTELYVCRSKPSKVSVNGKKTTIKALTDFLSERIGGDAKALDIVTSSEVMSGMDMKDFAKYLLDIIPITLDFNKLSELASLSDEEQRILSELFPKAPAPISITDVKEVYKILFDTRTVIGRQMDAASNRAAYEGALPLVDKDQAVQSINLCNQKIGAAAEVEKAWEVYRKRMEERNRSIELLTKWIDDYNKLGKTEPVHPDYVSQMVAREKEIRTSIENDVRAKSRLEQSNVPLQKMLANLDSKVCPVCDRLTCDTDKTACKKDIEAVVASNLSLIREIDERAPIFQNELGKNLAEQESVRERMKLHEQKIEMYKRILSLKESIPVNPPAEPKKPMDVTKEKESLIKWQNRLKEITVYEECCKALKEYEEQKKQYDFYCALLKKAEPRKGVLTNVILDFLLQPFMGHVNGFLKSVYGDIEISFRMEENLEIYCRPHGRGTFLKLGDISTGEKMIVTFALMDMVASISNTKMLFFDNMENLDDESMESLFQVLTRPEVQERYDHVIMSMVAHPSIKSAVRRNIGFFNVFEF